MAEEQPTKVAKLAPEQSPAAASKVSKLKVKALCAVIFKLVYFFESRL